MSKILYVDDERDNLVVFEALCEGHFDALTAESGEEALAILACEEVAVLLADQRMPGMTGVELAERASKEHPDVVRILVTAFSDLSEAIDAINRGNIRGYLRKPWDQEELLAILKEGLCTHAMRRRARELEQHMLATERVYTLGVVTAGIAHELKSPLRMLADGTSVVKKRLDRARAEIEGGDSAEAIRLIDSVQPFLEAQASSTSAMVDTCKGFEATSYTQDPDERCDLEEVVGTAARIVLASRGGDKQLQLDVQPTPEVVGNRHRLGRVIINLLVNAFDALLDCPEGVVKLRLFEGEGSVVLEVEDNGPGIAPRDRARIFDIFFSTKANSGTGLGLAISRKIIEELGGTLECESELGRGSLFRVTLRRA